MQLGVGMLIAFISGTVWIKRKNLTLGKAVIVLGSASFLLLFYVCACMIYAAILDK